MKKNNKTTLRCQTLSPDALASVVGGIPVIGPIICIPVVGPIIAIPVIGPIIVTPKLP